MKKKELTTDKITQELPKGVRLKNGSYEFRKTINGTQIQLSNKDLEKLMEKARQAEEALKGGLEYRRNSYTVEKWMLEWLEEIKAPKVKETSRATMLRLARRTFIKYLGDRKIKDLYPQMIQVAVNDMVKDGIAPSQIRKAMSNFKECMEFARANRMTDINPTEQIEVPWEVMEHREEEPLTREEQQVLLEQLDFERNWYTELIYVMLLTGARIGEIGSLTWDCINWQKEEITIKSTLSVVYLEGEKTLKITTPKTAAGYRVIPMMGECKEMLLRQKEKVERLKVELGKRWRATEDLGDLVFVTTLGSPITRYVLERELNKIVERINETREADNQFPHIFPHLLRHTMCTRCFEQGIEPKVVQKWAGHSSYNVTMSIYTHVMQDFALRESKKLSNAYLDNSGKMKLPEITSHSHI